MARRQVGLGALDRSKTSTQQYAELSTTLTSQSISDLTSQLASFQSLLSQFSQQHSAEIRSNPSFRSEFAKMCTAIGVDPLVASTRRTGGRGKQWVKEGLSGWGMLGVGEFWIGVATRVVGVCRRTRGENGGFIAVEEVRRILVAEDRKARRKDVVEISEDDIIRGINALEPLGPGISLITLPNGTKYIRSIPKELNPDQAIVLDIASITGGVVSVGLLQVNLAWEESRSRNVLEDLVVEGMVWVDDGNGMGEREYWIPRGISEL